MVDFQNAMANDEKFEAFKIANAFREASEDDNLKVMNFMSDRTSKALESFNFYIVTSSWFRKAWPLLTARSVDQIPDGWREHIGSIHNEELMMNVEREVSSSEEEGDDDNNAIAAERKEKREEKINRRRARIGERPSMRTGLVHEQDFFILGPSAWNVVKFKFGEDGYGLVEIARPCVPARNNGLLAIELRPEESEDSKPFQIEIPPSGRFAYEQVMIPAAETKKSAALVPQDENHNVCWGDSAEEKVEPATVAQDEPVLLLPPSTTTAEEAGSTMYTSGEDMDLESDKGSIISPAATPSLSGRKRLASGLGNLGNTCFMNSTLQCLAHTEPLRKYFLSGEYEADLNRDNPLGTGGELATQFANLISEMWGLPMKRRNVLGSNDSNFSNSFSSAVYPRSFKYTLGKHAEQFIGYDQHDSQELATYLLDALHEDTNRVTKKPYVEKPEQGEDEPDDIAASKAWGLHLQREDSRVLENFMGQVKSRLECCAANCNRVSTTFDPFMYLSVPIPGATDRTVKLMFVPLDPTKRIKEVEVTLNKTSSITKLMNRMNEELVADGFINEPILLEDLCAVDVFNHDVFTWYQQDSDIDKIRKTDHTYVYQLRPLKEIRELSEDAENMSQGGIAFGETRSKHSFKLDVATMTKLNKDDDWQKTLEYYCRHPSLFYSLFNPNRGTMEERMQFHKKLDRFIDICHKEISECETTGIKRGREERESDGDAGTKSDLAVSPSEDSIQGLLDRCDTSHTFKDVKTRHDVAILEFCAKKLRQYILKLVNEKRNKYKDGYEINIVMRRPRNPSSIYDYSNKNFTTPMIVRLQSNTTVYSLRKELAKRFSRSLKDVPRVKIETAEESSSTNKDLSFGSPELNILLQIPMTYDKKSTYTKSHASSSKLGMLDTDGSANDNGGRTEVYAKETNEAEQTLISDVVGPHGTVNLVWPYELCEQEFDLVEFESIEPGKTDSDMSELSKNQQKITVMDCIEKYCQKEQLEETEMWYCNRCKEHVRAWKQFHLYRAPPILIVHLKRFHFSASTHRRDKIDAYIDFPLEGLDLRGLVSHYSEEEKPIYDLYAVSNHYGGLGGGHYTAYIKSDDGTWSHYDDSRVTTDIGTDTVLSNAAYVLYYRRCDLRVGEDFEDIAASQMVYDQPETVRDSSEVSSNNTAQAGDDDMAIDGDGSSRTCSSPLGSIDGDSEPANSGNIVSFVTDLETGNEDEFPLQ